MRFQERQRFAQMWVWLLLTGVALAVAVPAIQRPRAATLSALGVVILLVVMFAYAHLDTIVTDDELLIRFRPFHLRGRRIRLSDVVQAEARQYSPIGEYGGWGIRLGNGGMAYNTSGNEGVQVVLKDGKRILIGSRKSRELALALQDRALR